MLIEVSENANAKDRSADVAKKIFIAFLFEHHIYRTVVK